MSSSSYKDPKTQAVQAQVDEVVGIMHQNIEKVMDRGERLDALQDRTDELQSQANQFKRGANKLRKQMWWKNIKLNILIATICIIIIIIIVVAAVLSNKK